MSMPTLDRARSRISHQLAELRVIVARLLTSIASSTARSFAFYRCRERWTQVMLQSIALNAAHFNMHRMVQQYASSAYLG